MEQKELENKILSAEDLQVKAESMLDTIRNKAQTDLEVIIDTFVSVMFVGITAVCVALPAALGVIPVFWAAIWLVSTPVAACFTEDISKAIYARMTKRSRIDELLEQRVQNLILEYSKKPVAYIVENTNLQSQETTLCLYSYSGVLIEKETFSHEELAQSYVTIAAWKEAIDNVSQIQEPELFKVLQQTHLERKALEQANKNSAKSLTKQEIKQTAKMQKKQAKIQRIQQKRQTKELLEMRKRLNT